MFLALGWVGATYYLSEGVKYDVDILSALSRPDSGSIGRFASFIFPPTALVSGIPVFSIVTRYNLVDSGMCSPRVANLWAVMFPWVIALLFSAGHTIDGLMNYVSLVSTIPLNVMLPCYLFVSVVREYQSRDDV